MIKVGWVPSSENRSHPADRRRFGWILNNFGSNVIVENAKQGRHYDVLYISISADLNYWSNSNKNLLLSNKDSWVVFDICDSLLTEPLYKSLMRPILRLVQGQTFAFRSYKSTVIKMIEMSDSVVCGSLEQKAYLQKYNSNVQVVRDAFMHDFDMSDETMGLVKNETIDLLWEGLANGNGVIFKELSKILENISVDFPDKKIVLHLVTDPVICKFSNCFCKKTDLYMNDVFNNMNIEIKVYDWSANILLQLSSIVDVALIPVPDDPVMINKPENKLILFWYLNIPVICSKTPSYKRVMRDAGLLDYCSSGFDWSLLMKRLVLSKTERNNYLEKMFNYISVNYTHEAIMQSWTSVFKGSKLDD